jgi:hypothetical protein
MVPEGGVIHRAIRELRTDGVAAEVSNLGLCLVGARTGQSSCRETALTLRVALALPVTLAEEQQSLTTDRSESRLIAGCRFHELLVVPGHTPVAVSVPLADLQEPSSRYFTAEAIDLVQHGKHHPRPAFTRRMRMPEIGARTSSLVGRSAKKSLDPLEPPFDVE